MSVMSEQLSWTDANQRVLVAEFARLRARLGSRDDPAVSGVSATSESSAGTSVDDARRAMSEPPAIDELVKAFGLTTFERDLLLLCAGVEMDAPLATLCAGMTGDARRTTPTFAVALGQLDAPHWGALAPVGPLRRWRLIELEGSSGSGSLSQASLRIDERILHFLAGVNYLDVRLRGLLEDAVSPVVLATSHEEICERARGLLQQTQSSRSPILQLTGDDPLGQRDVASQLAVVLGRPAFVLRGNEVPAGHEEVAALATLWDREAVLLGAILIVAGDDSPLPGQARRLLEQIHGPAIVCASRPQAFERASHSLTVDRPDAAEQRALWREALQSTPITDETVDAVAAQFRFSARRIAEEATRLAADVDPRGDAGQRLWGACRSMTRARFDELAQRIDARATWSDLILPEAQQHMLRQIGAHVQHRLRVYADWGFAERSSRGLGITALFAGESGTGKTMAAEVLANELRLDVYRIDLSSVVSKYIGETEKNLRRVFDAAEESGAILLFDEADALFGKRSEVKDSHDRYANIEVSYLLQRMEAYRGLAILTTNQKAALDVAFQRRLRFVVQFPFPDEAHREAIWRGVFPDQTPTDALDFARLARLNVAGGNIRNIALAAAFRAAEERRRVSMSHLLEAAHLEASKGDRPLSDAETRGWV
jgi:hypothetical protein